jgi:sRNA-binding protein
MSAAMSSRRRLAVTSLLVCAAVAGSAGTAGAQQRRVAILEISGTKSGRLNQDLTKLLRDDHEVVSARQYRVAARKLQARAVTAASVKKTSRRLGIDGVIEGRVDSEQDAYVLRLRVREGKSGRVVKKFAVYLENANKIAGDTRGQLRKRLNATITDLSPLAGATPNDKIDDELDDGEIDDDELDDEIDDKSGRPSAALKRLALVDNGGRSKRLRTDLSAILGEGSDVVPAARYDQAARKLRVRKLDPRATRRLSNQLKADGLVEYSLSPRDEAYELSVRVYDGSTGQTVSEFSYYLRAPKVTGTIRSKVSGELLAAVDKLGSSAKAARPSSSRSQPSEISATDGGTAGRSESNDEAVDFEDMQDDAPASRQAATPATVTRAAPRNRARDLLSTSETPAPAIDLHGGLSMIGRRLSYNNRANFEQAPPPYEGDFTPSAYLAGEVYPIAQGAKNAPARNIGLALVAERSVGLESGIRGEGVTPGTTLATVRSLYGLGLRYRYHFDTLARDSAVIVGAGYSLLTFEVDTSAAPEGIRLNLPGTTYRYVDPSLKIRIGSTRRLAFEAEGRLMMVLDAGDIVTANQYGRASVVGGQGEAALRYSPIDRVALRLGARYTGIGYTFQRGAGEVSSNLDGDPNTLDVGGAKDQYFGGFLTVGFFY